MSIRWVAGPAFNLSRRAKEAQSSEMPVVDGGEAKRDPTPTFIRVDEDLETTTFRIDPYSLVTHHSLVAIRTYFVASGTVVEDSVEAYTGNDSKLPYSEKNVEGFTSGVEVEIPFPDTPPGDFIGQPYYGYAD